MHATHAIRDALDYGALILFNKMHIRPNAEFVFPANEPFSGCEYSRSASTANGGRPCDLCSASE